jgi:hypothetical protein
MSIIDLEYLKSIPIPIKDSQWDAIGETQIQQAIDEAESYIIDYLDRHIASAYFTEEVAGRDRPSLVMEEYPIDHIESIHSYDLSHNITQYDLEDFYLHEDAGIISWKNQTKNLFYKNNVYVVEYQAGFSPVPLPIKKALALQTIEMLQPIFRKTNSAMSMVDLIPNSTELIVELLEKYRRKRIG